MSTTDKISSYELNASSTAAKAKERVENEAKEKQKYRRSNNNAVAESPKEKNKRIRATPPKRDQNTGENYSEAMYKDKKSASKSEDEVSVPTELGDRDDPDEYMLEEDEEKNRIIEQNKFEKAKARFTKKTKRNMTRIMGTERYNPFQLPSSFGSFGSNFETKKKKDLKRALYLDDPLELHLVKGWFKLLTKSDFDDQESVVSVDLNKKTMMPKFLNFKRPATKRLETERLLSADGEDKNGGCMSFVLGLCGGKGKTEDRGRAPTGATDLNDSVTPSEAQLEVNENLRRSVKSAKTEVLFKGECLICQRKVRESDQLKKSEGNADDEPIHLGCVKCELCGVQITKVVAMKQREEGKPCLCDKCSINVAQTKEAQSQLHSESVLGKADEYLALVPAGSKLFLPVKVKAMNGMEALGMIAMCTYCGAQLRKTDKNTRLQGSERFHEECQRPEKLRATLRADIKVAAAGLDHSLVFSLSASSPVLKKPLEKEFLFKLDESSLQYDLRQAVRSSFTLLYNFSSKNEDTSFLLDQLRVESFTFVGTLKEDFGPFLAEHSVVKQEQVMTPSKKHIELKGRYEHGILYEWNMKCVYNDTQNIVTPVSLEITLRIPQLG